MRVMVCDAGDSGRASPELEAALEVAAEAVAFSAAALATAAKAEASPELVTDRGHGAPHDHDFRLLLAGLPSSLAALSSSQHYGHGCSALGCVSAGDVSAPIVCRSQARWTWRSSWRHGGRRGNARRRRSPRTCSP